MTGHLNADPAELAKFSELAHRWWDPESEFRPLHQINPLRLDWIQSLSPLAGQRVIDIGCGGGILADSMARAGATVTGIDLAGKALKVAQLHAMEAGTPNIAYREISAEAMAREASGSFDTVTCMEMLEHVPDPGATIDTLAKLVRPGGMLFLSTINRDWRSFLLAIVGAEYVAGLVPKGTHEYERLIRPAEIAAWARAAGLELLELAGLEYNPLTHAATLVKQPKVNYLCALRKPAE